MPHKSFCFWKPVSLHLPRAATFRRRDELGYPKGRSSEAHGCYSAFYLITVKALGWKYFVLKRYLFLSTKKWTKQWLLITDSTKTRLLKRQQNEKSHKHQQETAEETSHGRSFQNKHPYINTGRSGTMAAVPFPKSPERYPKNTKHTTYSQVQFSCARGLSNDCHQENESQMFPFQWQHQQTCGSY